jgi:hypothetical protein
MLNIKDIKVEESTGKEFWHALTRGNLGPLLSTVILKSLLYKKVMKTRRSPMAMRLMSVAIVEVKQTSQRPIIKWVTKKINYIALLCTLDSTLSYWSRLHLQFLVPSNPQWAYVVCYLLVYYPFYVYISYSWGRPLPQQWGHK